MEYSREIHEVVSSSEKSFLGGKVLIRKIEPANPKDNRGPTFEVCKGENIKQITVYIRKDGVYFAGHFHTGEDPSKNPEHFFVADGKLHLLCLDGRTGESIEMVLERGEEVLIYPGILHHARAIGELTLLEVRKTPFDNQKPDTLPEDQYSEYIKK